MDKNTEDEPKPTYEIPKTRPLTAEEIAERAASKKSRKRKADEPDGGGGGLKDAYCRKIIEIATQREGFRALIDNEHYLRDSGCPECGHRQSKPQLRISPNRNPILSCAKCYFRGQDGSRGSRDNDAIGDDRWKEVHTELLRAFRMPEFDEFRREFKAASKPEAAARADNRPVVTAVVTAVDAVKLWAAAEPIGDQGPGRTYLSTVRMALPPDQEAPDRVRWLPREACAPLEAFNYRVPVKAAGLLAFGLSKPGGTATEMKPVQALQLEALDANGNLVGDQDLNPNQPELWTRWRKSLAPTRGCVLELDGLAHDGGQAAELVVCEGEIDAIAIAARNLDAVRVRAASGTLKPFVGEGRWSSMLIEADGDEIGTETAVKVARRIDKRGIPVRVRLRERGDPADDLAKDFEYYNGATVGNLAWKERKQNLDYPIAGWLEPDVRLPKQLMRGTLEVGAVSLLFGKPGDGKSTMLVLEMLAAMTGRPLLGVPAEKTKVMVLQADESMLAFQSKLQAAMRHFDIAPHEIDGQWFWLGGRDGTKWQGDLDRRTAPETLEFLESAMLELGCRALFIDSLSALSPEAEIENAFATRLLRMIEDFAHNTQSAVRLAHHSRKGSFGEADIGMDEARGAGAIMARVRIATQISTTGKAEERRFVVTPIKGSNFALGKEIVFEAISVEFNGYGETAPVFSRSTRPDAFYAVSKQTSINIVNAIVQADAAARYCEPKAHGWAGYIVGDHLNLEMGQAKKANMRTSDETAARDRASEMLAKWERNGVLKRVKAEIKRGNRAATESFIFAKGKTDLRLDDED